MRIIGQNTRSDADAIFLDPHVVIIVLYIQQNSI